MTNAKHEAVQEARALLRLCRDEPGASGVTTLTLLIRAMERLADAIEADADSEAEDNTGTVEDGTTGNARKFDRSRPVRGYNRDE